MFSFRDQDLPFDRELRASLQTIMGVGWRKSILVTSKAGICYPFAIQNLSLYHFSIIFFFVR